MKVVVAVFCGLLIVVCGNVLFHASAQTPTLTPEQRQTQLDAIGRAEEPMPVHTNRPEQQKTAHDLSDVFDDAHAEPSSPAFRNQPGEGKVSGFDFYRDPLNSSHPFESPDAIKQKLSAQKSNVMAIQRKLLESRYELQARPDPQARMSRGKPLAVGPTARLKSVTWQQIGELAPDEIRKRDLFPYPSLPHPLQAGLSGMVFPKMQIEMFPRLQRFDVDFDLPEEFLPEFPPAIFLSNRPELGDVSRGEIVSINNYYRLFKSILTPVQLDGLRLLLTPFPQEEFNPTDDRKSPDPSLGVTCFDCHVNGHTTGQFHVNPDMRPGERRLRLDTVSLRGVANEHIHGSKRSLRSVEDFTEFEQRTAYFNGDEIHALKKGMNFLDRVQVSHMAQMQNSLDFPPAPKSNPATGRLDRFQSDGKRSPRRGDLLRKGTVRLMPSCAVLPRQQYAQFAPGAFPVGVAFMRQLYKSPPAGIVKTHRSCCCGFPESAPRACAGISSQSMMRCCLVSQAAAGAGPSTSSCKT
jgi:hypothetical protein